VKPTVILLTFGMLPVLMVTTFWPPLSLWFPSVVLGIK